LSDKYVDLRVFSLYRSAIMIFLNKKVPRWCQLSCSIFE
ncbi:MAG: hypothetical protein ACI9DO_002759, partial [Reinekea sp.]